MNRPQISREEILNLLMLHGLDIEKEEVVLIGIRGYFRDSMGKVGRNDIGIFDDGFIWVDKGGGMMTFNGNVDPSRHYQGVAQLKNGKWKYKRGKHGISRPGGGYDAFRQAAPVIVQRWQEATGRLKDFPLGDTINIHKGGLRTTSSAGCQTLPPDQWKGFKEHGYEVLERYDKKTFTYLLVENDGSVA